MVSVSRFVRCADDGDLCRERHSVGMIGGFILGRSSWSYLSPWVRQFAGAVRYEIGNLGGEAHSFTDRLPVIVRDAWGIVRGCIAVCVDRYRRRVRRYF